MEAQDAEQDGGPNRVPSAFFSVFIDLFSGTL